MVGPIRLPPQLAELMAREAADARQRLTRVIERMEKVYYFIEDRDIRAWLVGVLPQMGVQVEDLSIFYQSSGPNVNEVHLECAEWILQSPRLGLSTAAVVSGRPEVCVPLTAASMALAMSAGISVTMLPQIFTLPRPRR